MKNVIIAILLSSVAFLQAQDYYTIHVEAENTDYNYPKNVTLTLIDEEGKTKIIDGDSYVSVTGNYQLAVKTPWKEDPEILDAKGKTIRIDRVDAAKEEYDYEYQPDYNYARSSSPTYDENLYFNGDAPTLISKDIFISEKNKNRKNLVAEFSNGLVFKYTDGKATAFMGREQLEVTDNYIVKVPEGRAKISFRSRTGEFWYVFDKKKD